MHMKYAVPRISTLSLTTQLAAWIEDYLMAVGLGFDSELGEVEHLNTGIHPLLDDEERRMLRNTKKTLGKFTNYVVGKGTSTRFSTLKVISKRSANNGGSLL